MPTGNEKNKTEIPKIAEQDWDREIEILKLLARKRQISMIAAQFSETDRQIRRIRNKAKQYQASIIATLPIEVQDYLVDITAEQRPGLRQELESIKREQAISRDLEKSLESLNQETRTRLKRHWCDLSHVARDVLEQLLVIKRYVPTSKEIVWEYAVNHNKKDILEVLDHPLGKPLLSHMQSELPELHDLTSWADIKVKNITEELLNRLSLRVARQEFEGTCDVCEDWY